MRTRFLTLALVLFVISSASIALAGPNEGGILLIHSTGDIDYTDDIDTFCGLSDASSCYDVDLNVPDPLDERVWWVSAAFPYGSSPRLAGITFGVDYDPSEVFITVFGMCGDFELPETNWPAPGTGNAVTWGAAETGLFTDIYWFAGYFNYTDSSELCMIGHPQGGGFFDDDDVPSNLDPIADYGCLGFGTNPGYNPCVVPNTGACCFPDGHCELLEEGYCYSLDGLFLDGPCDPNPCEDMLTGACCFDDYSCLILREADCYIALGDYQGDGVPCEPNPCLPTPTIESTWGRIKRNFR